jgi:hypothetical protein
MNPAPNPPSLAEVGAAIKEEIDRNNAYLKFAQEQIERDRSRRHTGRPKNWSVY